MREYLLRNVIVMPALYALGAYLGAVQMGSSDSTARISAFAMFVTSLISTLTPATKPPPGTVTVTTTPETVTTEHEGSTETVQNTEKETK